MSSFLLKLSKASRSKQRRARLLEKATKEELNSLRNICHNICKKKFVFSAKTKKKIHNHRRNIRELASHKKLKTVKGLRRRLIQKGGWLPIILPTILSLLSSIGGKAIGRAIGV